MLLLTYCSTLPNSNPFVVREDRLSLVERNGTIDDGRFLTLESKPESIRFSSKSLDEILRSSGEKKRHREKSHSSPANID